MKYLNVGFIFIISSAVILSICVYYDRQRHKDPEFKKKLREKRQRYKKTTQMPEYEPIQRDVDPRHREALIIHEIQIAEHLMARERIDEAILHFAHAISVCADPGHLLNCLFQTLPPYSYDMLIEVLVRMYGDRFKIRKVSSAKCLKDASNSPRKTAHKVHAKPSHAVSLVF